MSTNRHAHRPAVRPRCLPGLRAAALVAALAAASSAGASETLRLNFGVYSSNKPSAMVRVFKPVLQALERRMSARLGQDVDIRMQIAKDYERGITDLTEGRVDFSHFGPASYIEAKRANPDISLIAMENQNDSRVFYGIIAVHRDSDIESVEELRGRSFAFGDEGSTIGRFLSQLYLEQKGIRAGDLNRYDYLGRHDRVGTAVGAGDFDAGALNEKTFKKLVEAGEPIRELARFPNVTKPLIARAGLDPEVFGALQASLLEIDDPTALAGLKIDGFLMGDDSDYNDIRDAIENNDAFFSEPLARTAATTAAIAPSAPSAPSTVDSAVAEVEAPTLQAAVAAGSVDRIGNRITINITLPPTLFAADGFAGSGPHDLTINLVIPDPAADETAGAAAR